MAQWLALVESNTTGTGRDFAEAARRLGLRPVLLTSGRRQYPYAGQLGLDVRIVDTGDPGAVLAACTALTGLRGVTSSSDHYIETAARTAGLLGLPAADAEAIALCRDKVATRRRLRERCVAVPAFAACYTPGLARAAATWLGRVVVKPSHGSGSVGVRSCADPGEAAAWAERLLTAGPAEILVEQEVDGPEFSVEMLHGAVVGITRKHLGAAPYFVEAGHDFPAPVKESVAAELVSTAGSALRAAGLTSGPAHVELRLAAGRPRVIEINPRLAGGLIPRLIRHATGRDLIGEVVAHAAGCSPPAAAHPRPARHASIRFLIPPAGTVASVSGVDSASGMPGIVAAECTAQTGDRLVVEHSFTDRRGYVLGVGPDAATAIKRTERAHARITITMADKEIRDAG